MDNSLDSQVIQNTNNREETQRRAFITRVCGEEHNATFDNKVANLYFATDGRLIQMSEFKFKLIFSGKSAPLVGESWTTGNNTFPELEAWKNRYPIGSGVNIDNDYGYQCWDYAAAFWLAQTGRSFVMPTLNVKDGFLDPNYRATNAGTEFEIIYDWNTLMVGDWVLWDWGLNGHIAIVVGISRSDEKHIASVLVWDQNGTGQQLPEGGWYVSEHYLGSAGFIGAFRYKKWHEQGPVVT